MLPTSTSATVDLATAVPAGVDGVAVLCFKDATPSADLIGAADGEALQSLAGAKILPAKANEVVAQLVAGPRAHRLLAIGLGEKAKFTAQTLREAGAALAKATRKQKLVRVALVMPQKTGLGSAAVIDALATGFLLGQFQFREYKGTASKNGDVGKPVRLTIVGAGLGKSEKAALDFARIVADGQNLARTIASRPGNTINPPALAEVAKKIAKEVGLSCRVIDEKQLKKLGCGGILAVGSGSATPPRFIVLEHAPASKKSAKPILLVGKSITFDTGGVSIKPADKMGDMVFDKCGGMAVLGVMTILARSKYPGRVVGILTSAENHLSGDSYRPGDIIRHYNGVTSEITNTDAEGRLVLLDAIAWGLDTFKPAAVVDLATLTGGCVVALGHTIAAVMSNDDALTGELLNAAAGAGESVWRMPVGDEQREMIKSNHADIVNSAGRWASPLTGAAYVSYALQDSPKTPWAHFDIAGVADTEKDLPLYVKGATGWGVRTLVQWLRQKA